MFEHLLVAYQILCVILVVIIVLASHLDSRRKARDEKKIIELQQQLLEKDKECSQLIALLNKAKSELHYYQNGGP